MRSCKSQHNTLLSCQASSDFPSIKSKIVQAQSPSSTLPLVSDAEGGVDDKVHCVPCFGLVTCIRSCIFTLMLNFYFVVLPSFWFSRKRDELLLLTTCFADEIE
jgi:hypothetical protein